MESQKAQSKFVTKINYHFTNKCNYFCHHCFVNKSKPEIPLAQKIFVINHIAQYFKSIQTRGFINLVGGEPTQSPDFGPILEYIHGLGIGVGIVTNGTGINEEFLNKYGPFLDEIGLSIDSLNAETNRIMGRCDYLGTTLSTDDWFKIVNLIKTYKIKLKINICLTWDNCQENFSSFLQKIQPDRLKIMVLSIVSGVNDAFLLKKPSPTQICDFFMRHRDFSPVLENDGDMQNAYAMVNSEGYFCINDHGVERKVLNLIKVPLSLDGMTLIDMKKYGKRYIDQSG